MVCQVYVDWGNYQASGFAGLDKMSMKGRRLLLGAAIKKTIATTLIATAALPLLSGGVHAAEKHNKAAVVENKENANKDHYEYNNKIDLLGFSNNIGDHKVWSKPYGSKGAKYVRNAKDLKGEQLELIREAKNDRSTWYQFKVGGKVIGWVDTRAVNIQHYEKLKDQKKHDNVGEVKEDSKDFVWKSPYGTKHSYKVKPLSELRGEGLQLVKKAKTGDSIWYQFKLNGEVYGWIKEDALNVGMGKVRHKVVSGETLEKIGKKYDKPWKTISELNHLANPNVLHVGQILLIAEGVPEQPVSDSGEYSSENEGNPVYTAPAKSTDDLIGKISGATVGMKSKYKILPSVALAQAILESRSGQSGLAVNANNLFGIKGTYKGQSVEMPTKEFIDGKETEVPGQFRKYPSWNESLIDYAELLAYSPRYAAVVNQFDYKAATKALQSSGYATDPGYANKLNHLIETYNLTQYDK